MSRGKLILLILVGVIAYLIFLITRFPAAQAWALVNDQIPVQASGLSGTVWEGRAATIYQDGLRLDGVAWTLHPGAALTGRLAADISANLPDGRMRARIERGASTLRLKDARLDGSAAGLLALAGERRINAAGRVDALLREVEIVDGRLHQADGLINWQNAVLRPGSGLPIGNLSLPLGNLALRLEPADQGTHGTLVSEGGPLDIEGELKTDPGQGRFVMELMVRVIGEIDAETRRALQLLGVPTDGSPTRSRLTGNLDGTEILLTPAQG